MLEAIYNLKKTEHSAALFLALRAEITKFNLNKFEIQFVEKI